MGFIKYIFIVLFIFLSGCAGLSTENEFTVVELPEPELMGVYHKVNPGETLWRIAKTYNVSINDIITANNIPNAAQVENGQLVFIPGAYSVKEVMLDDDTDSNAFIWPVKGKVIGYFHEHKDGSINKGIDIKARDGDEVRASRAGTVVLADHIGGYGYTIIIDHSDGYYTVYSNNGKILVNVGDIVLKNQDIAYVGRDNRDTYLHFELRNNSVENNPLHFLP